MTPPEPVPGRRAGRALATLASAAALALTVTGPPAQAAPHTGTPASTAAATAGVATVADLPELDFGDDASPWMELLVDGLDVERDEDGSPYNAFGGFGAVSCNNTGNLLLDYKEENPDAYWRIMELLFDEVDGAGLQHIKVELGSDTNTSSGAEPATKRSEDEPANVLRGAGFHFIADALSINPDIAVEALRWGEPSWTGTDFEKRYQWYKETIDAAYDTYGAKFTHMSPSQNEVHRIYLQHELDWTIYFAERLEQDAQAADARYDYSEIDIVALDTYRNGEVAAAAILSSPAALEQIDTIGIHYTIGGGPNLTRLNKEHGMEVIYSEAIAPMIDPEYRIVADPARGGIGGTTSAVDIADRFINAYRWEGTIDNPAHMTSFLFQPAVSALYEGSQFSPKHLLRASDPWSGYYEGDIGIVLVRHFMQFIGDEWEYIEGASYGDGPFADGGTAVDQSTRTHLTLRTPGADGEEDAELSQVHANNTDDPRYFEVKVANLGTDTDTPLYVWETTGPDAGEAIDSDWFQNPGYVAPVRTDDVDGVEHDVYRVMVEPYSIMTLSTLPEGIHGDLAPYSSGEYDSAAQDEILELPYTDDFEYADYPTTEINGVEMDYLTRRGGKARYTADQNGAFEVETSDEPGHGNRLVQQIHADNRGYRWKPGGSGPQDVVSTAAPATVLGDHRWTDYTASADVRFDDVVRDASLPNFVGIGVRQVVAQGADLSPYAVRLSRSGAWELRKLDGVVASGTVADFDPDAWHHLALRAEENVLTPLLDGEELTSWVDASANPVMAGRISLVSGYYNTQVDNLAVEPVEGRSWASEKLDDTSDRITYSGATFNQTGFGNHNRTTHSLPTGATMTVPFEGTGINLFGNSAAAGIEVVLDGGAPVTTNVGGTGDRQTSFWLRGLDDSTPHTLQVRVVSGTFTVDGVDVVQGRESGDPDAPVAVTGSVARTATLVGDVPELPDTVTAVDADGETVEAQVRWNVTPDAFDTAYELVTVTGTLLDNPALSVQAPVEVLPEGLTYLIDANGDHPSVAPRNDLHPTVTAFVASQGGTLLNDVPDQQYSAEDGWGWTAGGTGKGALNLPVYDKTRETGRYGDPVSYVLTLPAGEWMVSSGHTEWWNLGDGRSRVITPTVSWTDADGQSATVRLGTVTFPNGSAGQSAVATGTITLTEETRVTYTAARDGGTESAAVSWIGVAGVEDTIDERAQTITFDDIADQAVSTRWHDLDATASSGLPVTFATDGICTVQDGRLRLRRPGTCTVTASQVGDEDFDPAPDVTVEFEVLRPGHTPR